MIPHSEFFIMSVFFLLLQFTLSLLLFILSLSLFSSQCIFCFSLPPTLSPSHCLICNTFHPYGMWDIRVPSTSSITRMTLIINPRFEVVAPSSNPFSHLVRIIKPDKMGHCLKYHLKRYEMGDTYRSASSHKWTNKIQVSAKLKLHRPTQAGTNQDLTDTNLNWAKFDPND